MTMVRMRALPAGPGEGCDTSSVPEEQPERHFNIHTSPEVMAGVYANFANVSHSDYEFTVTFARVDHEVEDEEIPGVVVTRVSLSPRFMRELIDAMEDNYSKGETGEATKTPRGYAPDADEEYPRRQRLSRVLPLPLHARPDALHGGRVGAEEQL